MEQLSKLLNVPQDQITLVTISILSTPLGFIQRKIKNPTLRHVYSLFFGILWNIMLYEERSIHSFLMPLLVYIMVCIFGRKAPIPVNIVSLGYLSAVNLYRLYTDYGNWSISVSTVLMLHVIKTTSFAWCYADGGLEDKYLSPDQQERKIVKLPSLFEYASYMLYYGGITAGPTFDFIEYKQWIEHEGRYKHIPNSTIASLKSLVLAFLFMGTVVFALPKFPVEFSGTKEYGQLDLLYKFFYYNVAITLARFRYYSGWILGQAAINASGLSFNGYDKSGKAQWNSIVAAEPKLELIGDPRTKLELWNAFSQVWLKKYIYLRIAPLNKSSKNRITIATYATLVVSALWHGFYPMYYTSFIQLCFVVLVSKYIYNARHKFNKLPGIVNAILRQFFTNIIFNYLGNGFVLLSTSEGFTFYKSIYYIPTILIFGSYFFFMLTGWGQKTRNQTDKAKTY